MVPLLVSQGGSGRGTGVREKSGVGGQGLVDWLGRKASETVGQDAVLHGCR